MWTISTEGRPRLHTTFFTALFSGRTFTPATEHSRILRFRICPHYRHILLQNRCRGIIFFHSWAASKSELYCQTQLFWPWLKALTQPREAEQRALFLTSWKRVGKHRCRLSKFLFSPFTPRTLFTALLLERRCRCGRSIFSVLFEPEGPL